eukprot:15763284-Heterocapsa_arctica.AAC.1
MAVGARSHPPPLLGSGHRGHCARRRSRRTLTSILAFAFAACRLCRPCLCPSTGRRSSPPGLAPPRRSSSHRRPGPACPQR